MDGVISQTNDGTSYVDVRFNQTTTDKVEATHKNGSEVEFGKEKTWESFLPGGFTGV